jgi:solute carrier family 50 (sugar transporter)
MSPVSGLVLPAGAVAALSAAGPLINLGMQASSLNIAMGIKKNGSVGSLSPVPFVALLMNCVIWAQYGLLKGNKIVYVPGLTGALAGVICTIIYDGNSREIKKSSLYRIAFAILGVSTAMFMKGRSYELGLVGCGISLALMASPLAAMGTVLRDRSTASMPFATSALTTLNVLVWLVYGLVVADDIMIYGPNVAGLLICGLQMALYLRFGIQGQNSSPPVQQLKM